MSRQSTWLVPAILLLAVNFLLIPAAAVAQEPIGGCGTKLTPEDVQAFKDRLQTPIQQTPAQGNAVSYCVPIAAHIVRQSDGTGGMPLSQLDQGIVDANIAYANTGITFHLLSVDYIDSDVFYNDIDTDLEIDLMLGQNRVSDAINVYFTPNLENEDGGLCGRGSFTTNAVQGVAMANGCMGVPSNPSTFPHELGHYFDLFHTHETAFGTELVDGSNCDTAGDLLCDTPADPNLSGKVDGSCNYTGNDLDPNGDSYNPDPSQMMSYAPKTCRTVFSPQSEARALSTLLVLRSNLLRCPPVADAGSDITAECESHTTTAVMLDGSASYSDDEPIIGYLWAAAGVSFDDATSITPTGQFPKGTTLVTLTVTDGEFDDTDSMYVSVVDTTPPQITCPADITVECTEHGGVPVDDPSLVPFLTGATATDICDDDVTITHDATGQIGLGDTDVTFTATDDDGNSSSCTATITVEDTTPPEITVELNRDALWPPNHKMADISSLVEVTDICDPNPTFVLTSVESDEPENGIGDGDTAPDIDGVDPGTADLDFQLRSERQGGGDGRTYTIIYTASDLSGNTAEDTVMVNVPHDQSGGAMASSGFTMQGTAILPEARTVHLVIPGGSGVEAQGVDPARAYVGNLAAVVRPLSSRFVDVNGDGTDDLELVYDAESVRGMRTVASRKDPIGLHYRTESGADYLVSDIFDLGPATLIVDGSRDDDRGGQGGPADNVDRAGSPETGEADSAELTREATGPVVTLHLAHSGAVRVEVFSVLGRKVRTLVNRGMGAGTHELRWNGRDDNGRAVSNGVYFYRIETPGAQDVKKVRLLR